MTTPRSQAELSTLRKLAQDLASTRKERTTSVHLLAAIASREGQAAELLRERKLDTEALLKASRSFDEDGNEAINRAMSTARDVGKRAPAKEPTALHLLLALLADRSCAAHRALVQAGVDAGRLRAAAMQISLGVIAARRTSQVSAVRTRPDAEAPPMPARFSASGPVAVPIFPPKPRRPATALPSPMPSPPARTPAALPPGPVPLSPAKPPAAPSPAAPAQGPAVTGSEGVAAGKAHVPPASLEAAKAAVAARPVHRSEAQQAGPARGSEGSRFALDRARFPALTAAGKNLTLAAAEGRLEKVIGREAEIEQALDILAKRRANSPCLVGPPGVGKTSVARGIAASFATAAEDSRSTAPRILIEIVTSELVAGTGTRGALAERMSVILSELRDAAGQVVLFVDEVHEMFGGGGFDEAMAEVKLALSRGELTLICATTREQYKKTIEPDGALVRRLTVVEIDEPKESDALLLLRSVSEGLGEHHGLGYSAEALAAALAWSVRYLPGRALPDKAISILDLAGARTRRRAQAPVEQHPGVGATRRSAVVVEPKEVAEVVSGLAEIPIERLLETDAERMLSMEKLLAERVVGHRAALSRVSKVLRRNAAGLRSGRPIGSFLLLGPTGVGKTETAKAVASALFHSENAMTRLDLSEYAEPHAIARLIGAPPGYVGHEAGGQLTEAVRRRPYQVILLDEIEKAHRDVLEAFLQVFDEGRMTDGRGRSVDFTNTVIVMTSNLGAAEVGALRAERTVGFSRSAPVAEGRVAETMIGAARAALPPELYNRIDEVLCYGPLAREEIVEIGRRLLRALGASLERKNIRLDVDDAVFDALLASGGFDEGLGARPMKRAVMRHIEAPLAEMLLRGELPNGAVAMVLVDRGEIVVDGVQNDAGSAAGT